jgi:small-conductance mechanosensitive channel
MQELLESLASSPVELAIELAWVIACLGSAFLISWWWGRHQPKDSLWFGHNIVDGILFPFVALALCYGASRIPFINQHMGAVSIAVPILFSLAIIRLCARVLSTAFPGSAWVSVIEKFVSWVAWLAAIAWIGGFLPAILAELDAINLQFGKTKISIRTLLDAFLLSGFVLVLVLWLSKEVERKVLKNALDDLSMRKVAINTIRGFLLVIGLLFTLSAVGVDLTALSVLGGALGVGLGLGLQKLAANYISGFVILIERSLRIGDTVNVRGFEGVITDIKTRYTLIRASNGRESVVPNEMLLTERVESLSLADTKILLQNTVTVSYAANPEQVQLVLERATSECFRVLQEPAVSVQLVKLGGEGLDFVVNYWIADPENGQGNVRSEVNFAILHSLNEAKIAIPFAKTEEKEANLVSSL